VDKIQRLILSARLNTCAVRQENKKMMGKEMWIITGLTVMAGVLFLAYLLYKVGRILQLQDERDTQRNYEWDEDES
jgi:hypothetical protein